MVKKTRIFLLALLMAFCFCAFGCGDPPSQGGILPPPTPPSKPSYKEENEIDFVSETQEQYKNDMTIEGQWGKNNLTGGLEYGIGDPFVMRHNGKYYLYPSTLDGEKGIKVFESADMVHWDYKGYAVPQTEDTSQGAYAPEVVYYNGAFYMCQSKGGSGHFIYKSDNPVSGFTRISENIGRGIDGAFYIDDDGELYLLHTGGDCIEASRISDIDNLASGNIDSPRRIEAVSLGGWVEGPGVFTRDDYSYITYTGNHVLSKGYRVAYSYAHNVRGLTTFTQPESNITLISTQDNFSGLGHSSNVTGRDLDSIYTAYHNLADFVGPPSRHYNLDRYMTNGRQLLANGVTNYDVALPKAPDFESDGNTLEEQGDVRLSADDSRDVFTAEINFTFADASQPARVIVGYRDEDNFAEIIIRPADRTISLRIVQDGTSENTHSAKFTKNCNFSALNTVRVESGYGKSHVYLNGMRLLRVAQGLTGGKIGVGSNARAQYAAFSNDAFGSSDFDAVKNIPSEIVAVDYLKGENRGFSVRQAAVKENGYRQGEKESTVATGEGRTALCLGDSNDWVKYAVNVPQDGEYAVWVEIDTESYGAALEFIVDNETLTNFTVPVLSNGANGFERAYLGTMTLSEGEHSLKVRLKSGKLQMTSIILNADAVDEDVFDAQLTTDKEGFTDFHNNFTLTPSGAKSPASGAGLLVYGSEGAADYVFSCDFTLDSESGSGGIVFRMRNYSYSRYDTREGRMQGYFLKLTSDGAELIKYDYAKKVIGQAVRLPSGTITAAQAAHIEVEAVSNRLIVRINGETVYDVYDENAFTGGKVGLYTEGGTRTMANFRYETI